MAQFLYMVAVLLFGRSATAAVEPKLKDTTPPKYLVNIPECKIPNVPLFPKEILEEWNKPFETRCPQKGSLAIISDHTSIKLGDSAKGKTCYLIDIERPDHMSRDSYKRGQPIPLKFGEQIDVSSRQHFIINCTGELEFVYNFPPSHLDEKTKEKVQFWSRKTDRTSISFNVMFIVVDSVSRNEGLRSLPKTMKYLTQDLDFIDYKGYHCVGEPTSVNYFPMMLGVVWDDLIKKRNISTTWDDAPLIWKNFSDVKYLTMSAEDMAAYNVFTYNGRKGFTGKPIDFNLRPFMLAANSHTKKSNFTFSTGDYPVTYEAQNCVNSKNVWDFLLDYTADFVEAYPNAPKFITTFICWPNHDFLEGTKIMDDSFLNYFKRLQGNPSFFDNSIIFFMADHGFRYASYSRTKYGLLERNLPLFQMRLPKKFKDMYPDLASNALKNSEKLTSHLDMFKTIGHLHQLVTNGSEFKYGYNMKYGRTLFGEIPTNRTCEDANIPPNYCSCGYPLYEEPFDYNKYKKMH